MNSKRGPIAQAALDSITVLFGAMFFLSLLASLPLAIFLMVFAQF